MLDESNMKTFTRYFDKSEYYYVNGKVALKTIYKNTFNLKKLNLFVNRHGKKIIPLLDQKFLTFDIETQVNNGVIEPIMINIYDGMNHYNYFLPDFINKDEMIITALHYLLKPKYHNYKIYVHNFSNFDAIFIIKYLLSLKYNGELVIIKPIIKNGKFINLDILYGKYKISRLINILLLLLLIKFNSLIL